MIFFSNGGKGGVGKSLVAQLLIAVLGKDKCLVIDSDVSNPDVFKCANEKVGECQFLSLKEQTGWDLLLDFIETTHQKHIVINCQAANQNETNANIADFADGLLMLKRRAVMLWVANEYEDSAQLLNQFLKIKPVNITIHVVMNDARNRAKAEDFKVYSSGKLRSAIEAQNGKYVYISAISKHVIDKIYSNERALLADILETGTVSQRLRANKPVTELRESLGDTLK